jgi:uncharacterized protein YqjF (DUF2071 family)
MTVAGAVDPDIGLCAPEHIARPMMTHRWTDIAFLHWPVDAATIQALLPPGLEVDTFDGYGWIGIIPFHLSVRLPPWMPSIPRVSQTLEVNVRTYVRGTDGRRGIWFLSLDAVRLATVLTARAWYRIPYMWARMDFARRGDSVRYRSDRRRPRGIDARFDVRMLIEDGLAVDLSPLERFLACRWRLYSPGRRGLMATQIEHPPWKMVRARAVKVDTTLTEPLGIRLKWATPLTLFSRGTEVSWGRRLDARGSLVR